MFIYSDALLFMTDNTILTGKNTLFTLFQQSMPSMATLLRMAKLSPQLGMSDNNRTVSFPFMC